jgi:magnesium-transporting ATPase (P-type)
MNIIDQSLIALDLGKISGFSKGFTAPASETPSGFADLLSRVVAIMTIFASLAFILWFVFGAFTWITGDNPQQLDKAKKQMSSAILGLIIAVLVIPLTWLIGELTGLKVLDFENIVSQLRQ